MAIEQQIKEVLERELPDSLVEVERNPDTEKIGGHVIWQGFAGNTSLRRQKQIFIVLRRVLRPSVEREISFIFTYTPTEYAS